jgi:hypothetical protein
VASANVGTETGNVGTRTTGILVFRDMNDGWVNTRRIWNQHAYSVTNVNDDGTIPAVQQTNWLPPASLNTFRSNTQGTGTVSPFAAPDLIVTEIVSLCLTGTSTLRLSAHVHNQGDAAASAGVKVAFRLDATLLGVATVPAAIPAQGFADAVLEIAAPGGGAPWSSRRSTTMARARAARPSATRTTTRTRRRSTSAAATS